MLAVLLFSAVVSSACRRPAEVAEDATRPGTAATTTEFATSPVLPETPPEITTATPPGRTVPVLAYLVRDERVIPVRREASAPAVARGAMLELLDGPAPEEGSADIASAVPQGTKLLGVSISNGVATVDLSGDFASGGGTLSMSLRLAQVVFTLTQFKGVKAVDFRMDGEPLEMLGGEGILIERGQSRDDWEDFSPAVLIESPAFGDTVASPVEVSGSANVFEGVLRLELTDATGKVLISKVVQATSGTGTRGTFAAKLAYPAASAGSADLVASVASPKDGSKQEVFRTRIRLR